MKIQISPQNRKALLQATVVMQQLLNPVPSNGCQHPREKIVGMFPKTTGGKEVCLCCKQVRYQVCKNGPWLAWKDEK